MTITVEAQPNFTLLGYDVKPIGDGKRVILTDEEQYIAITDPECRRWIMIKGFGNGEGGTFNNIKVESGETTTSKKLTNESGAIIIGS